MSWEEGKQRKPRKRFLTLDEMEKIEGFLDEDQSKLLVYQFLRTNPTFFAKILTGMDIFPFQHIALKSMFDTDYGLYVWGRGLSKSFTAAFYVVMEAILNQGIDVAILSRSYRQCLHGDSLVLTNGGLKELKDISIGDKVISRFGANSVVNKWKNESADGLEIKTKKGYSIKGKLEHKVLFYNQDQMNFDYKEIKDLRVGDYLPISLNSSSEGSDLLTDFKFKESKNHWCVNQLNLIEDEDLYYYMGLIMGDGYFGRSKLNATINLTTADEETLDWVAKFSKKISPNSVPLRVKSKEGAKAKDVSLYSTQLADVFEYIGYKPNTIGINKYIPKKLFLAKREYIAAFIRGLMDSDGYFSGQEASLSTSSKEMAKQFQILLLTFGIISNISEEPARGEIEINGVKCICRESYKVRITHYKNLTLFQDKIGFGLSRKRDKLREYLKGCNRNNSTFVVPNAGKIITDKYDRVIKKNDGLYLYGKNLEISSLEDISETKWINEEDKMKLREIIDSNFYLDKVESIIGLENLETYDIEVENEHCYWGNGFINHNSRMIFKKIEDIMQEPNAHLLRECIPSSCISKGNTECLMKVGRSSIRALPLGDGEKLRGFRFQRIVVDEFLLMPDKIYKEIIIPFLAVTKNPSERQKRYELETELIREGKLKEEDRYEWPSNKLMALSSASYQFEYLYALYQEYENLILGKETKDLDDKVKKDAHRCILHFSHEIAPSQLYDASAVNQAKSSMSLSQFEREYNAVFTDDSSGYFSVKKMNECTIQEGMEPSVEIYGDPTKEYIVSFDPSWAESDSSDDFAIQVIKYDRDSGVGVLVHSYAIPGTPLGSHIRYFSYILSYFKPVLLVGDYNGGQQFISSCNESSIFKDQGIELKTIPCELFDDQEKMGINLNEARTLYSRQQNRIVILRQPSSSWIRQGNELLQASIDHQRINFASPAYDSHYNSQIKKNIGIKELTFSKEDEKFASDGEGSKMVDFLEHQSDMIRLTKKECGLIQVHSSPQGSQVFDLPANLKKQSGSNKTRKDSYSALVLANWGMKVYSDIMAAPVEEVDTSFTPMFIR